MINQTAEYALRAVVWLATHPDETWSTSQLAGVTKVPQGYLSKTLQILGRAGLVESNPGRAGGFRLVRPAAKMTVLEVVNAVEPVQRIKTCPLGLKSHRKQLCPLHRRLDAVAEATEKAFAETTIAEIADDPSAVLPLCDSR